MVRILLGVPLGGQKVIIPTPAAGVFAANLRPGMINGAATLLGIEETADLPEMNVLLAPHRIFLFGIALREFRAGLGKAETEMFGQPFHISLGQRNQRIRTAVTGTFRTIIHRHCNDLIRVQI